MSNTQVVHASDLGAGLEIQSGKVVPSATMATDAELDSAQAAAAIDASAKANAAQASATADAVSAAQALLDNSNAAEALADAAEDDVENVVRLITQTAINSFDVDVQGYTFRLRASPGIGDSRIIAMGAGKGGAAASNGHFNLVKPSDLVPGTVVHGMNCADGVIDANGFFPATPSDNGWGTWYVKLPPVGSAAGEPAKFYYADFTQVDSYQVPDDLILLAQVHHDLNQTCINVLGIGKCWTGTTSPDTHWAALPFTANVVNYYGGYQVCQFRRADNRVYVRGVCEASDTGFNGTGYAVLAVLPEGFRPTAHRILHVNHHVTISRIDVLSDGSIVHIASSGSATWVPLEFSFDLN